jgi:DNA-binding transcriptional MerR regulator
VGTSPDTLRYYERIGLLPKPQRTPSGYRQYGEEWVDRLRFIKGAQRFGLRLDGIAELLQIRDQGLCACGHTRELLEARLTELDAEMATLGRLRDDIRTMMEGPTNASADTGCTAARIQMQGTRGMPAGYGNGAV